MPAIIPAAIGAGASLIGASKSASAAKKAAATSAKGQVDAATLAAEEARFRPVDYSDPFGTATWTWGDDGRVSGVNLDPSGLQQGLFGDASGMYQNYMDLLRQYQGQSLTEGAGTIYDEWQGLLAPTRQTQQSQLFDALQAKGITGISGYDPLTGGAVNPMAQGLFSAWAGQDKQMSADSISEFLNRLSGLTGSATGAASNLYGVGRQPAESALGTSMAIGGRNMNPTGAQLLGQGLSSAAQTQASGQMASAAYKSNFWDSAMPGLTSGAQSAFSSPFMQSNVVNPAMNTMFSPLDTGGQVYDNGQLVNLNSMAWY